MDEYTKYLEAKLLFTEDLLLQISDTFNKGGTIPCFPDYEEWSKNRQPKDSVDNCQEKICKHLSDRRYCLLKFEMCHYD